MGTILFQDYDFVQGPSVLYSTSFVLIKGVLFCSRTMPLCRGHLSCIYILCANYGGTILFQNYAIVQGPSVLYSTSFVLIKGVLFCSRTMPLCRDRLSCILYPLWYSGTILFQDYAFVQGPFVLYSTSFVLIKGVLFCSRTMPLCRDRLSCILYPLCYSGTILFQDYAFVQGPFVLYSTSFVLIKWVLFCSRTMPLCRDRLSCILHPLC